MQEATRDTKIKQRPSGLSSWSFLKFWKHGYPGVLKILEYKNSSICPAEDNWFKALELTTFDKVKVVILGQDPYHTKGVANGLAFSVQAHVKKLPPSLRNILREYQDDLGYPAPRTGDLRVWAERGVLLLNTILTVEEGKPLSHKNIGWEKLCYEIVRCLAERRDVVFVLWGQSAQDYTAACGSCPIVANPHPSPLSKGFLGSRPFTRVNEELKKIGKELIEWRL